MNLSIEEFLDELLDLGDSRGTSDQHDFVNLGLGEIGIFHNLLYRLHRRAEQVLQHIGNLMIQNTELQVNGLRRANHVEFLELGASDRLTEVFAVEERLDLDASLMLRRQRSLRLLDLTSQLLHGAVVLANIFASLLLVQSERRKNMNTVLYPLA